MKETNEEDDFQFDNEGKCCDAVIRTIENEIGSSRVPESIILNAPSGLTGKNVEVKLTIGCQVYALEHTRIFGFSGHQNKDHKNFLLFRDKFKKLESPFPGHYYVYTSDIARKHFSDRAFFDALTVWTYVTAATLNGLVPSDGSKGPDYLDQDGVLTEFDLTVKLVRREWIVQSDGSMDVMLYPPLVDRNPLGHQIEKALNKKCEQLKPHRDAGARSVLILEMVGCSTNHRDIIYFLQSYLENRENSPDDIFIVDTINSTWFVLQVKRGDGDVWWPGGGANRFCPDDLINLTA